MTIQRSPNPLIIIQLLLVEWQKPQNDDENYGEIEFSRSVIPVIRANDSIF